MSPPPVLSMRHRRRRARTVLRTGLVTGVLLAAIVGVPRRVAIAAPRAVPTMGAPPARLPTATLRDQFDRITTLMSPPQAPVIIVVSDREGSDAAGRWDRELRAAGATSAPQGGSAVRIVAVADLAGAPRLLRGVIRRAMPRDTAARVLLDWEGALGRPVRGTAAHLVAAAYGRDGRLRRWDALPLTGGRTALAQALVRAATAP